MKKTTLYRILSVACVLSLLLLPSCARVSPTPLDDPAEKASPSEMGNTPLPGETSAPSSGTVPPETVSDVEPDDACVFFTDAYNILKGFDGSCYLQLKNEGQSPEGSPAGSSQENGSIEFSSVEDMYEKLSGGELSAEQIAVLKRAFPKTEKGIALPRISPLLIPVLPEGVQRADVSVLPDRYSVSLTSSAGTVRGGATFMEESLYRALYEKDYTKVFENDNIYNLSTASGEFENIPCQIGNFNTSAADFRDVIFRIEGEGKTLSVHVRYCINSYNDNIPESDTIPRRVTIFCEQEGQFAIVTLNEITIAPTVEWLSSFGIASHTSAE